MSRVLGDLLKLLKLETIEKGLYRGQTQDLGLKVLFGGHVMGQALSAAQENVDPTRNVHSLHAYFLRAGDPSRPIVYEVQNLRDGKSFSARRVKAIQNGEEIFYMTASFKTTEKGFNHQDVMPDVPPPEELKSYTDIVFQYQEDIPDGIRGKLLAEKPIEVRPVVEYNMYSPEKSESVSQMWIRANGRLCGNTNAHSYMLAYMSDFQFLSIAALPYSGSPWLPDFQVASLDHAMWFHRPFKCDEWLLYCIDSPSASNGVALVKGQIFNRKGELIASTIQEGVIRQHA